MPTSARGRRGKNMMISARRRRRRSAENMEYVPDDIETDNSRIGHFTSSALPAPFSMIARQRGMGEGRSMPSCPPQIL
jgi:hypothetical protein